MTMFNFQFYQRILFRYLKVLILKLNILLNVPNLYLQQLFNQRLMEIK